MTYPYPLLKPPSFHWLRDPHVSEPKVHEWIQTLHPDEPIDWSRYDVTILGVPLSRSSISASCASENPDVMRAAWKFFNPYHLDYDVDFTAMQVVDLGDVRQHVTDIARSHQNIKEAMIQMRLSHPHALPIMLGGDHSVTAMLVKGWKESHLGERIGILQFDTHFDLRSLDDNGPTNGTPIRNLIDSGTVKGSNVWNIGLHGFYNARSLKEYADQMGVHYVTLNQARKQGIASTVGTALANLSREVDTIYLTVDMDVLDIGCAPGAPASTPGGMQTYELFDAVYETSLHKKVKAMDIVCLDPMKDVAGSTIKAGVHTMLTFLTGYYMRIHSSSASL
ncbi:agmatinase family protein [Aneurinibacillus sp. Ricciae_BoGa-3]|uniref:agmatinase family protein n=1 Tax=Aneurinibacillus sp. Ricciae_BoGa-3 TaxID=3022697 RepID=UPI00233F8ACD|nr:agmatinase family protein [Aneurinibacillus sp. Ricciae_BoGa-3]WCK54541.1 agmatinase family protein [Aneurinibacillus sp. Ricciae_BoGa-3]